MEVIKDCLTIVIMLAMVALLLRLQTVVGKLALIILLALLALKREKRWPLPVGYLFFLLMVTISHMFVANGQALFFIFSWPVTDGALLSGINKGLTFIGLLLLSRFLLAEMPLRFNKLATLRLTLACFGLFARVERSSFRFRRPVESLDETLWQISKESEQLEFLCAESGGRSRLHLVAIVFGAILALQLAGG